MGGRSDTVVHGPGRAGQKLSLDIDIADQGSIGYEGGGRAERFLLLDVARQRFECRVAVQVVATGVRLAGQISHDIGRLEPGGLGKRGLIEGLGRHPKEHTNQRSQPTAQTMAREGDGGAGIGGLDLQVVLDGLQQLGRPDASRQTGVCHHVLGIIFVVSAGVGDNDFGAALVRDGFEA